MTIYMSLPMITALAIRQKTRQRAARWLRWRATPPV
jgi:hypothetical protein